MKILIKNLMRFQKKKLGEMSPAPVILERNLSIVTELYKKILKNIINITAADTPK